MLIDAFATLTLAQPLLPYVLSLLVVFSIYAGVRWHADGRDRAIRAAAIEAGLTEPASLHPLIDPARCLGCGACARVCPEGSVIGLIDGKASLIEPTQCIGHGACKDACPHGAISLVFGTAERGVDIPHVGPDFQTNVPGIYIAGELGGMGLIRNAIEQGRQAVNAIRTRNDLGDKTQLDVLIVGGGPAGFAASLAAIDAGLCFVTIEQDSFGGTVAHFPRGKVVMTQPATLPLVGKMPFREVSKEKLISFWSAAAKAANLNIQYGERLDGIAAIDGGFCISTTRRQYLAKTVVLAIGRRGTPRRLEVPGEDRRKVAYRLDDPEKYRGQSVLVVGGGDSALEAAATIAEQPDTKVVISYRGESFGRAKLKNRRRVEAAQKAGNLQVALNSHVLSIAEESVDVILGNQLYRLPNDAVIICAGGVLPAALLKSIGVRTERMYGTA